MRRAGDRLLLRTAVGAGPWTLGLAAGALVGAAGETVLPAVLGRTLDAALDGRGGPFAVWGAASWPACCAALVAVIVASAAIRQVATGASGAGATAWLRGLLCRHVLMVGTGAQARFSSGDVVSRVVGASGEAGAAPAAAIASIAAAIPALGAPVALALIDPWLALVFVAGLPALALALRAFVRDTSAIVARYQRAQGEIAARLLDALGGARTIAAAGTLEQEARRALVPLADLRAAGDATWRTLGRASAQASLAGPLLQAAVLGAGGMALAAGRISPGELLAAGQYAVLGAGLGTVVSHLHGLARGRAGASRAAELLAMAPTAHGRLAVPAGPGRLEFRRVVVRRGGEIVLDELDLVVEGGAAVAVVGRSGVGKSLLAALAGRLADPDRGDVLLDGVPLRRLDRRELRRAVQLAFDRPALLGGTLGGAIRFGATAPSRAEVELAARAACADAFIRRLPRGYDTALAGAPMSGGEVQRVGLARAFAHARETRLLVLDDATSSLDTATEMQVGRVLTGELGRRTRLVVAHRAATAARADLVAWLDGGRIRARAPHAVLWSDPDYRAAFAAEAERTDRGPG